jgi:zinc protease
MIRPAKAALVALALSTTALSPLALAQTKPAPAAEAGVAVPPIVYKERTLANGLKVYTSRDATTPNVTVQVWYGVGSKDDPEGRSGFAHLFEHLMFKSTRNMPNEFFDRLTEDVGGFNAWARWSSTTRCSSPSATWSRKSCASASWPIPTAGSSR